jgi:hypothetical protein
LQADVGGMVLTVADHDHGYAEELARRYLDGASLDDLGVLCGCTATRIRRILVAQGVEIRPRGHDHGKGRSTKFVRR